MSTWRDKYPQVQAETSVAHGGPARVLVGMSHTAQVVIVGSRGHGSWSAAVLGSVGLQLIHHADCPVLISRS
jgi:nucleotide-binding universal stress UspA family protein